MEWSTIAFPVSGALGAQGNYGEADALLLRAIGIQEKALGPDHPHLAASLGNRANVFRAQVLRLSPGEGSLFVPGLDAVE